MIKERSIDATTRRRAAKSGIPGQKNAKERMPRNYVLHRVSARSNQLTSSHVYFFHWASRAYFFSLSFVPPLSFFSAGWLAKRCVNSPCLWCSRLEKCFHRLTSSRGNNPKSMTTTFRLFLAGFIAIATEHRAKPLLYANRMINRATMMPCYRRNSAAICNKLRDPLLANVSEIVTSKDDVLTFGS